MGGLYVEADFGVNRPGSLFKPAKPLPFHARLPRPTGRPQEEGEREVVSSRAGARARQAHRLTPDTVPLEAEAIPRGTPSRA